MEVALQSLQSLPPDVAQWLLELRGGPGLPLPQALHAPTLAWNRLALRALVPLDPPDLDEGDNALLRSATLEDLSTVTDLPFDEGEGQQGQHAVMDVKDAEAEDDFPSDWDSSSSCSSDSLEGLVVRAPPAPTRPTPPLLPEDDLLNRLSGGECRALPAVPEEDEDEVLDEVFDEVLDVSLDEEEATVRQALGWVRPFEDSVSFVDSAVAALGALRRTQSAEALTLTWGCEPMPVRRTLRRTQSAPKMSLSPPATALPTPTTLSPTSMLTFATPSASPLLSPLLSPLSTTESSSSTACAEALEHAEALCRDLDCLTDRTLSVSVDEDMVFDDEFLALCSEANRLAETCLSGSVPPVGGEGGATPSASPAPSPTPSPATHRPKFDINAIFDLGGLEPPRPPERKRRRAPIAMAPIQDNVAVAVADGEDGAVLCHTAELLLMTRASERTHLKRSRSVSVPGREDCNELAPPYVTPPMTPEPMPLLCASSPELRGASPAASPAALPPAALSTAHGCCTEADDAFDAPPEVTLLVGHGDPHDVEAEAEADADAVLARKGSVTSDVVAWRCNLLREALSDDEDAVDGLSCLETKQWFSSSDNKGRVYFFEENSCESSWNLPNVISSTLQESALDEDGNHLALSSTPVEDRGERPVKPDRSEKQEKLSLRNTKSRSMVIVDSSTGKESKNSILPRNWPQLFDGDMCVLKEGTMYRTKITENGKKLRKNWASCHVVLTELFLLLFRDAKSFAAMKSSAQGSAASRPELCVDLNGALIDQIDRGEKASVTSRKNVFLVSTVLGLQVLFQCDSSQQAEEWFNAVHTAIHNLPSGFDSCPRIKVTKEMDRLFAESNSPEQTKKFPRIGRSKSVKIKNKEGSIEDLTVSVAERQTKIRARLKKFFNRRPTMESLVKKGIWKDEPAFGCYLEHVCGNESPRVPLFVQRCIAVIEGSDDNMKTDGLYRASGNLSQVQKIRLQVDQNNLSALDQEEDVHVLTGALKLFFRELKEPLIPYAAFSKAIKASTLQNKKDKLAQFRELVKSLPSSNHDTLKMLLKHLLKVTGYQEFNRMHIPNLAIVFGPTLMWPEQESQNMALDLMQQNLVIEAFLLDFENIFR